MGSEMCIRDRIVNYEPHSAAWYFAQEHGPSACGMAFRVRDAAKAYEHLIEAGAEPVTNVPGPMELSIPAIRGIGGAILYLVDRTPWPHHAPGMPYRRRSARVPARNTKPPNAVHNSRSD